MTRNKSLLRKIYQQVKLVTKEKQKKLTAEMQTIQNKATTLENKVDGLENKVKYLESGLELSRKKTIQRVR